MAKRTRDSSHSPVEANLAASDDRLTESAKDRLIEELREAVRDRDDFWPSQPTSYGIL